MEKVTKRTAIEKSSQEFGRKSQQNSPVTVFEAKTISIIGGEFMPNVYTKEYLDKFEVTERVWGYNRYPNAKALRNTEAIRLRKQGWTVKVYTYSEFCGLDATKLRG